MPTPGDRIASRPSSMHRDAIRIIDDLGGMAATHELYDAGFTRGQVAALVTSSRIRRVRQGWYVRPDLDSRLAAAARVGGRVTCAHALDVVGAWALPDGAPHIAVPPHAVRLRSPRSPRSRLAVGDARIHWRTHTGTSRLIAHPSEALVDLAQCASPELVRASADSLIRLTPSSRSAIQAAGLAVSAASRDALRRADGICESGTESLFHERMRMLPHLRRQVSIAGIGRVDFLIGERLVVEIDGFAYHSDPVQFESDRRRDAALSALGYRVLRFSYHQVLDEWPDVERAVWAAISRRDTY